jgi:hypothetical protein
MQPFQPFVDTRTQLKNQAIRTCQLSRFPHQPNIIIHPTQWMDLVFCKGCCGRVMMSARRTFEQPWVIAKRDRNLLTGRTSLRIVYLP